MLLLPEHFLLLAQLFNLSIAASSAHPQMPTLTVGRPFFFQAATLTVIFPPTCLTPWPCVSAVSGSSGGSVIFSLCSLSPCLSLSASLFLSLCLFLLLSVCLSLYCCRFLSASLSFSYFLPLPLSLCLPISSSVSLSTHTFQQHAHTLLQLISTAQVCVLQQNVTLPNCVSFLFVLPA